MFTYEYRYFFSSFCTHTIYVHICILCLFILLFFNSFYSYVLFPFQGQTMATRKKYIQHTAYVYLLIYLPIYILALHRNIILLC